MTDFSDSDDLAGARFHGTDLTGARFVDTDLTGVVMRGVWFDSLDIDAALFEDVRMVVNGVDVAPLVDAELDRRFPGRGQRRAGDPDGLRAAWTLVEETWAVTLARVAAMPAGTVDVSVGGEWSFAQTLRHLVFATDVWLGRAILRAEQPFHPLGLGAHGTPEDSLDMSVFVTGPPSYDDVLAARDGRHAQVRDLLAGATPELLAEPRDHPWSPDRAKTVLSCLHVVLEEEWEHHRFAVRDLDAIDAGTRGGAG